MDDLTAVAYGAASALLGVAFVFVLWMGGVMSGWIAALVTLILTGAFVAALVKIARG